MDIHCGLRFKLNQENSYKNNKIQVNMHQKTNSQEFCPQVYMHLKFVIFILFFTNMFEYQIQGCQDVVHVITVIDYICSGRSKWRGCLDPSQQIGACTGTIIVPEYQAIVWFVPNIITTPHYTFLYTYFLVKLW